MAPGSQKATLLMLGVFLLVAATTVVGQPASQPPNNSTNSDGNSTNPDDGNSTTTASDNTTTTSSPDGEMGPEGNGSTTASSDGSSNGSSTTAASDADRSSTTAAPGSNESGGTTVAGSSNSQTESGGSTASSDGNTTPSSDASGNSASSSDGSTTSSSDASGNSDASSDGSTTSSSDTSNTDSGSSSSGSSSDTSSSGQTSNTESGGTSSGSSSSNTGTSGSESSGTSSGETSDGSTAPPLIKPIKVSNAKVKVDETSISGTGLLVTVTKYNVVSPNPFKDTSKSEYKSLSNAVSKLTLQLKESSMGPKLSGNAVLKDVIAVNTSTVRGEYLIKTLSGISLDYSALNSLDQKTVFGMDELYYNMRLVPLAADNRWFSGEIRFPNTQYTNTLSDPESDDFRKFKEDFELSMREQMKTMCPDLRQVIVKEILKGSIVVQFAAEATENATDETAGQLSNALDRIETVGDLAVDPDSKSIAKTDYVSGVQKLDLINKASLPVLDIPARDNEDIKKGEVTFEDKAKANNVQRANYFLTVTIPSFAAVLLLIILLLCCTTSDSFICKICSNDTKSAA